MVTIPAPIACWGLSALCLLQSHRNSSFTDCHISSLATGPPKAAPFTFTFLAWEIAPSLALIAGFHPAWQKQPIPCVAQSI